MNGLMLLLETVIYIPSDLVNCAKAGEDAKAFAEWADIFLHPVSLVDTVQYNVKHHFAAITLEIAKAKKDLAANKFAALGEDLGELLVIVTTPAPAETKPWFTFEVWQD